MARAAVRRRLSWQLADVVSVGRESRPAARISLRPSSWPGHLPGQHVDVRLTAPDGYTAQRSYSIASAPERPGIELIVERLEDGEVSPYLTDELRPGDQLELRGPIGGYFVWPGGSPGPVQLIAGGSGVVPFLGMLDHHRATAGDRPVRLLYSVRTEDEVIGRAEFDRIAPGAVATLTYTRAAPPGWSGLTGRIGEALLDQHAFAAGEHPTVLVCGPTNFVEAVAGALIELGHDASLIRTERFGGMGGS